MANVNDQSPMFLCVFSYATNIVTDAQILPKFEYIIYIYVSVVFGDIQIWLDHIHEQTGKERGERMQRSTYLVPIERGEYSK